MTRNTASDDIHYLLASVARLKYSLAVAENLFSPKNESFPELIIFAPEFFALTQRLLTGDLFLSLARMLDVRPDVLALDQLIQRHIGANERSPLFSRAKSIRDRAEPIIQQRHKALAHLDYKFAAGDLSFQPINFEDISAIIHDIDTLIKDIRALAFPNVTYADIRGQIAEKHINDMLQKIRSANKVHPPYEA